MRQWLEDQVFYHVSMEGVNTFFVEDPKVFTNGKLLWTRHSWFKS